MLDAMSHAHSSKGGHPTDRASPNAPTGIGLAPIVLAGSDCGNRDSAHATIHSFPSFRQIQRAWNDAQALS